jgi:hypothetical protein
MFVIRKRLYVHPVETGRDCHASLPATFKTKVESSSDISVYTMYQCIQRCTGYRRTGMFFTMKVCLFSRILFADSHRELEKNTPPIVRNLIYAKRVLLREV